MYTFSRVNPPGRDMKKIITSIVSRPFKLWYTPIHGIKNNYWDLPSDRNVLYGCQPTKQHMILWNCL